MKFNNLKINGAYLIEPEPISDERGFFVRTFCQNEFGKIFPNFIVKQINQTLTKKMGTIRGMHYQNPPFAETKVVRCLQGSVFDVIVDLRKDSPTFLNWHGEILSGDNMKALFIPKGCAHGFQTMTDDVEMIYLHDEFYNKEFEAALRYDEPMVGIQWKGAPTELSERDKTHKYLDNKFEGISI